MGELKKSCRYCSNFRNNKCQLDLFEIPYIGDFFGEKFDDVDFDIIDKIIEKIAPSNPDDFWCKYYT